ncbi:alpha/beta hydrolase [Bacillus sp. JCM 19041]|uniref:alpha/beta fold hydrolase n=1 Tax=Bacillus sp. JCM 19041 TaxID=1460637 RepID=UPI0006D2C643
MPTVRINNVDLFYEVKGTGEAIVFTHGASWDHRQWQPQIEALSNSYKTICWDVRGHGQSSLPEGKVDSNDFSDDLVGLLAHLGVKQAHLCGLSMGGHISLQTAIRYPETARSLILIGTPYTNTYNRFEKIVVPINRFSSKFIPMSMLARMQAKTLSKFNADNEHYIKDAVSAISLSRWIRLWNAISRMESGDHLHKVNCQTLLLQGDHDTMIERQQEDLSKKIKHSRLVKIKNAHHATNLDNPKQVNAEIIKHITSINLPLDSL